MAHTSLDFLIKVDITGATPLGDIKNLNTVLVLFDGTFAGVDVFEDMASVDGSGYTADQKDVLKAVLRQNRVARVKAAEVAAGTTLSEIEASDNGWFAAVFADEESQSSQAFDDLKGSDYLLFYGHETDGVAPVAPDDTYNNIFAFASEGDEVYANVAAGAAKVLAFDPDRNAAQWDWQNIQGGVVSEYDATQRTALMDLHYNVYGKQQGKDIFANGVNTQGMPINAIVAAYWLRFRLREAISAHQYRMVNQYGMNPYDNDGLAGIADVCFVTMARGERIGHFVRDTSAVRVPTLAEVSEMDLQTGSVYIDISAVQRWRINNITINGTIQPTIGG